MNGKAVSTDPHLKVVARPSLYTSNASDAVSDKKVSILASLETDDSVKKLSSKQVALMLTVVLVAGLSYWAYANSLFQRPLVVPAWIETALNISKSPIPVIQRVVKPVEAKLDRPINTVTEEPHAATIVTEAVPGASSDAAQPKAESVEKVARAEPESAKKAIEDHLHDHVIAEKPAISSKQPQAEIAHQKNSAAQKSDVKIIESSHTSKLAKVDSTKNAKDEDVDLIAALLSRVSRPEAQAKEVKRKMTSSKATATAGTTNTKRQNQADSNRDIVMRTGDDTTESLLKRCKALGFIEGELCRVRICSKLWGKDPACPAPEQVAMPNQN